MKRFFVLIFVLFSVIFGGVSFAAEKVSAASSAQSLLNSVSVLQTEPIVSTDIQIDSYRLHPRNVASSDVMDDNVELPLKRFGMEFFENRHPGSVVDSPTSDSYVLAPGDEVKLSLWSIDELHENLRIDNGGTLALPRAGAIRAAGMSFGQLRNAINAAYSRILTDFQINISMGRLGNITVYVAGMAQKPGSHAVSSSSSVIDVLAQAGGPSLSGSMRKIELRRKNKTIYTFDAYELLLHGKLEKDMRVIDGDVVFVHTVGALVAVGGNVKRPAVYELSSTQAKLSDVLGLAGGLASGAFTGRVQVANIHNNEYRTVYETEIKSAQKLTHIIRDGDFIKIFAVPSDFESITLAGAVTTPGEYMITPGTTTLGEVLKRAGGLLYTAEGSGELTRVELTPSGPIHTRADLDLKDALLKGSNFVLRRSDYIFARSIPDVELTRIASITGRVRHPGQYTIKRGEKISSLIERAGGFAGDAFLRGTMFTRESVRIEQQKNIEDMTAQFERDVLSSSNQSISTAINERDVNFARIATEQKIQLVEKLKNLKATGRIAITMPAEYKLLKGSTYDIEIQNGDTLHIPDKPGIIQVIGSVLTPSAFVYRGGQPFTEYVRLAGGFTASANARASYIVGADGTTKKAFSGRTPLKLDEGDFVVVPEKVVFKPTVRNTLDVVDILQKLVLGVAAINYVFK